MSARSESKRQEYQRRVADEIVTAEEKLAAGQSLSDLTQRERALLAQHRRPAGTNMAAQTQAQSVQRLTGLSDGEREIVRSLDRLNTTISDLRDSVHVIRWIIVTFACVYALGLIVWAVALSGSQ